MKAEIYTLPEWSFVGGESQHRIFVMELENGGMHDLPDATAHMAVVDFVNRRSGTVIEKDVEITEDEDSGFYCDLHVRLTPSDTLNLSGKYIYQISIKDREGNLSIPQKGIMYIADNIDKSFAV